MSIARHLRRTLNRRYALLYQRLLGHGEMKIKGLRRLFANLFNSDVGMYSYGCFNPIRFDGEISIERYWSFATTCRRMNGNHSLDFLTLHPSTYNVKLGVVHYETIRRSRLRIEGEVWVGHIAIEATQWWLRLKEELSEMVRTTPELVLSPAQYFVRQENA